jgi:phage-related minor tail protein
MIIKMLIMRALSAVFSIFTGGAGEAVGAAVGGAMSSKGNKVYMFADGGIVGAPTVFKHARGLGVAGEAGAEAILPLANINGKLGVVATTGKQQNVVNINVINNAGVEVAVESDTEGNTTLTLEDVRGALASDLKSGTGFASSLENSYKISRNLD